MLYMAEYILQMIEESKKQNELDMKKIIDEKLKNLQMNFMSNEAREEAEYELYYTFIKMQRPDQFDNKGDYVESFPLNNYNGIFQIIDINGQFFGVYKKESKEAHKVTRGFQSKEEVLLNTFGTSDFERFRGESLFLTKEGMAFCLKDNKQFRLNLVKPFRALSLYENMEQARSFIVKDELKKDTNISLQALLRTLEEFRIPSDLIGETVTINSIFKDNEGVYITFEENQKKQDIRLPDLEEKWLERLRDNPKMKVALDELIMDSRSIGEGFLAYYGIEINKEFQIMQHDFEVISNKEGSYIGKLSGAGTVKKLSPYFSEKEAIQQLVNMNNFIHIEKQKERFVNNEADLYIEFMESRKK